MSLLSKCKYLTGSLILQKTCQQQKEHTDTLFPHSVSVFVCVSVVEVCVSAQVSLGGSDK